MNNDLISRSTLLEQVKAIHRAVNCVDVNQEYDIGFHSATSQIQGLIAFMPTVDAEPVRHGRYDAGGNCTVCGYPMPTDDRCDAIFPDEIKYCYNCGANMDGDKDAAD